MTKRERRLRGMVFFSENVAQPAEVTLLRQWTSWETAQPRQVALLSPSIFIVSGRRHLTRLLVKVLSPDIRRNGLIYETLPPEGTTNALPDVVFRQFVRELIVVFQLFLQPVKFLLQLFDDFRVSRVAVNIAHLARVFLQVV